MVITKSISRFARNTVTLLQTVREFKALGVDIYFEEQNIHTMSGDGELMMTILASYAQEESRSASENQKWRIRKNFKEGMPWNGTILGYSYEKGKYIVVPDEAALVNLVMRQSKREADKKIRSYNDEITHAQTRLKELDVIIQHLYEDNVDGKISDERFALLSRPQYSYSRISSCRSAPRHNPILNVTRTPKPQPRLQTANPKACSPRTV